MVYAQRKKKECLGINACGQNLKLILFILIYNYSKQETTQMSLNRRAEKQNEQQNTT